MIELAGFITLLILLLSVENPGGKIGAVLAAIFVQKMLFPQHFGDFGDGNVVLQCFTKEVGKLRATEEILIFEREAEESQ